MTKKHFSQRDFNLQRLQIASSITFGTASVYYRQSTEMAYLLFWLGKNLFWEVGS